MERIMLKDVCDIFDGPHATPTKTKTGPVYLGIDAITEDGRLDENEFAHLSVSDYEKWTKRVTPVEGDIVFSYEATLGRYAIIPKDFYGCLGRRLAVIRNKSEKINTKWLYYYFRSPEWRAFIARNTVKGSTVNRISVEDFPKYTIPLVERKQQDQIANILGMLDEKININTAINDNLQQQIKLLYDYWFSQFDFPNAEGLPYKSSGGEMEYSDRLKRYIPLGWTVESVIDNSISTPIKPGVEVFDEKTYLATADVNGTIISSGSTISYENREGRANMQPAVSSVWFAKMKNSIKHLYLNKQMQPIIDSTILSTGFCGLQCLEQSFEYMAAFIEHSYFESVKDVLAHGATQESVNNDDLLGLVIVVPKKEILDLFHRRTAPMYAQISKNICENQQLTKLRDWLLPMLMNGQAIVGD